MCILYMTQRRAIPNQKTNCDYVEGDIIDSRTVEIYPRLKDFIPRNFQY